VGPPTQLEATKKQAFRLNLRNEQRIIFIFTRDKNNSH